MKSDKKSTGLFKDYSDKSILDGIRTQDDKILNWLYNNYLSLVRNHVIKNSGSAEDVSDVFQDSIIILYKQITEENLKLSTDLKGYFFGIVRNVWSSHLRKKQRNTEIQIDPADEGDADEESYLLLEKILSRSLLELKPDQQLILKLFSEGYSFEEIAEKMDLKNETYARRKKYLSKEALLAVVKEDPEYQEYLRFKK